MFCSFREKKHHRRKSNSMEQSMLIRDSTVHRGRLHVESADLIINESDILSAVSQTDDSEHGTLKHPSKEDRTGASRSSSAWSPPPKKVSEMHFSSKSLLGTLPISPVRSSGHPAVRINHHEEQAQQAPGSCASPATKSSSSDQTYAMVGCHGGPRRRPSMTRRGSKHNDAGNATVVAPGFDSMLLSSPRRSPPGSASSSSRIEPHTRRSRRGIRRSSLWSSSLSSTTKISGLGECRALEYIMKYASASCPRISTQLSTALPGIGNPPPSATSQYHFSNAIQQPRAKCGCRGFTIQVKFGPIGLSFEACYRVNGVIIRWTWSDHGGGDYGSGMLCRDSVQVHHLGRACRDDDDDNDERDILGHEGRPAWSGLIKVAAVASSYDVAAGRLTPPPHGISMRSQTADGSSRKIREGILGVEEGDILVRVDDVQVSKKSLNDVISLLGLAKRPTRLTFVRHKCGRRFIGRDKSGKNNNKSVARAKWSNLFDRCHFTRWHKGSDGGEHELRAARVVGLVAWGPSHQKSVKHRQKVEGEKDACPVAALLRARRSILHCGMEELYAIVAAREQIWQRALDYLLPDSDSDRAKLRRLARAPDSRRNIMMSGSIKTRSLMRQYRRLMARRDKPRGNSQTTNRANNNREETDARVWNDITRSIASPLGCAGCSPGGCQYNSSPLYFSSGWSKDAVFRVTFAVASTLQFVSGMSYMAALMLLRQPVEAAAYASLVTLLQDRLTGALYPLADIDFFTDAYHMCGRCCRTHAISLDLVVPGDPTKKSSSSYCYHGDSDGDGINDYNIPEGERGYQSYGRIDSSLCYGFDLGAGNDDNILRCDRQGGAGCPATHRKHIVVGEMLPELVRAFGEALRRRLPALYRHFREQAIPMTFLCADWFTTAYTRNTPLALALCAVDLFLVRLDGVMIRLGLAILEVLAPALEPLNAQEISRHYQGLVANVPHKEVLRQLLTTQPRQKSMLHPAGLDLPRGSPAQSCMLS